MKKVCEKYLALYDGHVCSICNVAMFVLGVLIKVMLGNENIHFQL